MSKIIPFPALLPDPKFARRILAPPYDAVTAREARRLVAGNPCSFLHITRAEVDLPPSINEYDARVYDRACTNFYKFKQEGWLIPDGPSLYIYRLEHRGHAQTGLVCGISVGEYDEGKIRRHEKTREDEVNDRARLAIDLSVHPEPVFILFRASVQPRALIAEETRNHPLYDITDADGVHHVLWRARSPGKIVAAFKEVAFLYIADGHHRSEAASRVRAIKGGEDPGRKGGEPCDSFPAVIFPHDEVRVYRYDWDGDPTMRPLAGVSIDDILAKADKGGIVPPKSTWFTPKLASGLFVYPF